MGNYTNNQSSGGWRDKRDGGRGGSRGRDFGEINTWKRGGDRDDRPQMHSATCAECNERCEVPFKPTGSKPVYCSNCFRKDDDRSFDRPRSFDRRSDSRSEKPAYQSTPRDNNAEVVKQLKTIGIKMDKMISLLMELSGAVDGEVYEEIDGLDFVEEVGEVEEVKEKKDKKEKKTKTEKKEVKAKKEKKEKKTKAKAKK